MGDAGILAAAASAVTALLYWVGAKLSASVKKTTTEATGAVDLASMRAELDALNEFKASIEAERELLAEAERKERALEHAALEAKVEELERALKREMEDSAAERSGVHTQPMRRGK